MPMATPFRHLIVLMLENRSFDHMLGFLKSDKYDIDGLTGTESNPAADESPDVVVSRDARTVHDLNPDPGHDFINVNMQIYGNAAAKDTGTTMTGFVQDYALVSNQAAHGASIMKCFTEDTLPVLSTLAQQYAICDHWFSSVPGPTIPNPLLGHGASSGGSVVQVIAIAPATLKTIFEVMDDPKNPDTFRIYTDGSSVLLANLYLMKHQSHFHPFSDFRSDCLKGDLPAYTFIEPRYDDDPDNGKFATSQHPDFPVDEGERLISQVYSALSASPIWPQSLLLIVYDEHGGIFDHRLPPTLTADPKFPDVQHSTDPPFAFDRLGVRVPAVFVSPLIKPGTIIKRQFDHCSIVATVRKLFCLDKSPFNWREAQAATFEDILNLTAAEARIKPVALPNPVVSPAAVGVSAKIPPAVRKPNDLTFAMARAMEYSMNSLGLKPSMKVSQIYTAQDATNYLNQAAALVKENVR
jgi:phospholipase C